MRKLAEERDPRRCTDEVLLEVWRIKDELSAAYGHDLNRMFTDLRERQKHSGHPVVSLQKRKAPKPSVKAAAHK